MKGAAESAFTRALERACGGSVEAVSPIPTLGGAGVFAVEVAGRRVIVKDQPQPTHVDVEVWGLERFATLGLLVPTVIAVDTSGEIHPRPFFVSEYIDGVPITALGGAADDALVELGRQLRVVHEEPVEGYGLVGGANTAGVGMFDSLWDAMWVFVEFGLRGLEQNGWIDDDSAGRVRALFEAHKPGLEACPPRLLHGDVKAEHVLVDPRTGRLVGLIDCHPWSGEPAYDLARLVATGGEHIRRPLLSGYGPPSVDLEERWMLHELGFLIAITFGHRTHNGKAGADPEGWSHRLTAALDRLRDAL